MSDAKVVRFAAVIVVLASYLVVFRTGESHIADRLDENARIMDGLHAAERTVASRPLLEAERSRLRARLRAVDLEAGRSTLVARFVRDAALIAAQHRTVISAITASPGTASIDAASEPLQAIPLEITVDGRYADVLATIRALSVARVLTAVDVASLARKNAAAADPAVTAVLHVALQRLAPVAPAAPTDTTATAQQADVRTRPV